MPVPAARLSLATAKTWAKRLAKVSRNTDSAPPWPLARCQLAVATMLGYDHWHALNQALSEDAAPLRPAVPSAPLLSDIDPLTEPAFPADASGWPAFWHELLDMENLGGECRLEFRSQGVTLYRRIIGQLSPSTRSLTTAQALEALGAVVAPDLAASLSRVLTPQGDRDPRENPGYIRGELTLSNRQGAHPRLMSLPVYPRGMDVVLQAKSVEFGRGMQQLGLPSDLVRALTKLCSFKHGVFLFTGTAGAGKSTMMASLVNDLVAHAKTPPKAFAVEDPSGYVWKGVVSVPVERAPAGKSGQNIRAAVQVALRSDPDILVIQGVHEALTAEAVFLAAQSGAAVFSTCHAAQGRMLTRLADMGISAEDMEQHLVGWTYTRLMSILCANCSTPATQSKGMRDRGPGCKHCNQMGITGRQLVMDLWQMEAGAPRRLFSCMDQTRELVRLGRTALQDAEDTMGPLGL